MFEILQQFPQSNFQYICVSVDWSEISTLCPQIYVQIILTKVIHKIGWFLDTITGKIR